MSDYSTRSRTRRVGQSLTSSGEDESEDEVRQNRLRRKLRVLSSPSSESETDGSIIAGPSRKKRRTILSSSPKEQSDRENDSEDSDVIVLPRIRKRERAIAICSDSSDSDARIPGRVSNKGSSSDGEGTEKCIICFMALNASIAKPSNCNHKFHAECLGTWSKTSNTCPIDRVKYTTIDTLDQSGQLVSREYVKTPPPQDHQVDDMVDEPTVCCEVCHQHDRENEMLLCDRCDDGYHMNCLNPPVNLIPDGPWYCPICMETNSNSHELQFWLEQEISEDEVDLPYLSADVLNSIRRSSPRLSTRQQTPRLSARRQSARTTRPNARDQPIASTSRSSPTRIARSRSSAASTARRPAATTPRRRPQGRRSQRVSTTYKVEFVTVEDGSTIEVKLAVNAPSRRRKSRKKKKKKTPRNSNNGKQSTRSCMASLDDGAGPSCSYSNATGSRPLDLFGSRPQLDYFSGCEAEDELDEEGGASGGLGLLVQRATRVVGRSMTSRKQIAARILNSTPRRSRAINVSTAPVDLVSSIMQEQEKWHNPNTVIQSTSDGRVQVTLKDANNVTPRMSAGDESAGSPRDQSNTGSGGSSSGNSESRTSTTAVESGGGRSSIGFESRASGVGGTGSSSGSGVIHPLQPPPIPPSHLVDEEDFDLYADIEAPKASKTDVPTTSCKLAPPPEPPPMLLAMDDDDREEEASSPESLVIDDERQVYDPDLPTSPPSPPPPPPKLRDIPRAGTNAPRSATTAPDVELIVEYPPVHEISLPPASPPVRAPVKLVIRGRNNLEDCPNRSLYSNISRQLAQGSSDSEDGGVSDGGLTEVAPRSRTPPEPQEPPVVAAQTDTNGDNSDTNDDDEGRKEKKTPEELEKKSDEKLDDPEEGEVFNDSGTTLNSELNDENHSDVGSSKSSPEDDNGSSQIKEKSNGVQPSVNGSQESGGKSGKTRAKVTNGEKDGETEGEIELGCEEDKDGLVDITDDEISNYERRWELEEDNRSQTGGKSAGLEGLETEAISDCEYNDGEEKNAGSSPKESQENGSKEEGEIVTEERLPPVAWKKLSKGTKERSYRDKDAKDKTKKKESKNKKEKKKELERYDVRKLISEKPRRKVDEFGRDISSKSRSRSRTRSRSPSLGKRSQSRGKRKRSLSRSRGRAGSKTRVRPRSKSRGRSRDRSKENKSKRRSPSRSRSRRKSRSRSRKRQKSKSPVQKKKEKERERGRPKSKEKTRSKRRAKSSASCSSCSCSSCEREKRRSRKLTVTVPNKQTRESGPERASSKEKRKSRPRYKESAGKRAGGAPAVAEGGRGGGGMSPKRRRLDSPAPSKEVFTSGDNILVSVNFKASKSGEGRSKDSKKRRDEDGRKKKDKGTKENQPVRNVSAKGSGRKKLNTKNMKPVAIIDLVNASPFREQTLSPKEVIILTDSDSEEKIKEVEIEIPMLITGPKTPPEPHIKFNLVNNKQQQLRSMSNPLLDSSLEQTEGEGDDEATEIMHKGPNTPPEPPVPYDPFEPTKSRSPTPNPDQSPDHREPSPVAEIDLCPDLTPPQPQPSMTPPKTAQHESPKTPSPLHTPPIKPVEEPGPIEKPKLTPFIPITTLVDSEDDSIDMVGGDSPYSPGSAEGDDLFEPPVQIINSSSSALVKPKPAPPSVPRPIPLANNKHTPLKLTPSPLKKRPIQPKVNSTPIKTGRGNSKREIGIKLDEDQLKILDELPNSAVEMQVKDKFLKKLNRQERVVEEVKLVLKPHYAKKHITKEDYKEILRKSVPKICHSKSGEINPAKIHRLIEAYVKKFRHKTKKKTIPPIQTVQSMRNNKQKTMWC